MRRSVLGAVVFAGALGGCVLVSGGTDNYKLADAGIPFCGATSDCSSGQMCCLVASVSGSNVNAAGLCQTPDGGACTGGIAPVELCTSSAGCAGQVPCVELQCSLGAAPATFHACTTVTDDKLLGPCAVVSPSTGDAALSGDAGSNGDAPAVNDAAANGG